MAKKPTFKQPVFAQSTTYHIARAVQRISLLFVIGSTIVYWVSYVAIVASISAVTRLNNPSGFADSDKLNEEIKLITDRLSMNALQWAIIAAGVTCLLLLVPRFRKYDKGLMIDSVVTIGFCLLSVMFAESIIRYFLSQIIV